MTADRTTKSLPLSRHLLNAALIATLLPLLLMMGLGLWQYQRDLSRVETLTGDESLSSARVVSNILDFLVDDTRSMLERLAWELQDENLTVSVLQKEGDAQPQTEGVELTDAKGEIQESTIGQAHRSVADLPYFQQAKRTQAISYSDVFFSKWLKENVVMIAVPYKRHGQFAGVVMARLNLKVLHRLLSERLDDPRFRNTYVVDRQGRIISHYDYSLVEKATELRSVPPVQMALAGKSGWLKYKSPIDGNERISGYVPMPGTGWAVVSTRKPGGAILGLDERLWNQLLFSTLACVVMGLGAWSWGRRLAKPLETLETSLRESPNAGFAKALAKTHVESDVAEYESLAGRYNALAGELNERFEQILALQDRLQAQNLELNVRNDELAALTAQAQASSKLKDQFLANMSHELRTPLNSIIGFTELTLTDETIEMDEENRINHEIVLKSARHLLALINDILDLSKIEAGKLTPYVTTFDPLAMVGSVVETTEPLAAAKGIRLEVVSHPGLAPVDSDETKVRQILLNLVSNAIKFTPEGAVIVELGPAEPGYWQVAVRDTGIGIAPDDQEMVFEEFRQVDASTTRKIGGTGLGLSIARKLAHLLGGDLRLDSELGKGSTFTLVLPFEAPATGTANLHARPSEAAGPRQAAQPRNERVVLAIDDDPLALHLLLEKLKDSPYQVVSASTRTAGLHMAHVLQPHAILLDVKLRRQDDWELLRQLKASPETANVPVLVLSVEESRARAHEDGASGFVVKPLDRGQLLGELEAVRAPATPRAGA